NMVAVSRVPRTKELSAVGWSEDAATLSAVFHLPPGWDVFSVTGVDATSATWLSRWDLFDVFYLLLVTFSMFRLTGAVGGSACAVALVLCHEEAGAPEYVWLPLVALAALLSLIKEGRLRSWLSFLFYALGIYAIVSVVAFSVDQVRLALYPHLASDASSSAYFPGGVAEKAQYATLSEPASPEPAPEEVSLPAEDAAAVLGQVEAGAPPPPVQAKRYLSSDLRRREAPLSKEGGTGLRQLKDSYQKQHKSDAIVQTGPGIPEISGHSVQLSWSGPVVQSHKISL